jgi:hypothetical protein
MADTKLSALSEAITISGGEGLYMVEDIAGTPASKLLPIAVLEDYIETIIGAMVASNTETRITVTFSAGKLNFVVDLQSANDFTNTLKTKLDGIDAGANVNPSTISQAEAEAGTATTARLWTAERVAQAIAALESGGGGGGSGDVVGPASVIDNRVVRWNGTTGNLIQESTVTIDDSGNISGIVNITLSGTVDGRDIATDGTKLDGIATGATANDTDANLRARASHTGAQALATISDAGALAALDTVGTSQVDNLAITYAKIQNVSATARLLGRDTAGAGVVEELAAATVRTMLNVADGAEANTVDSVNAATGTVVLDPDDLDDTATTNKFTTAAEISKLAGIEVSADVTDAANVDAAGAVMEADFNANTVLAATGDNTPAALTVAEQTLVGRITAGNIAALTVSQIRTLLNIVDGDLYARKLDNQETTNLTTEAATSFTIGQLGYVDSSGTVSAADASAEATGGDVMLIMAAGTVGTAAAADFVTRGIITLSGLTAGALYYLSETAKAITVTAPSTSGAIVRPVGYALTTTKFMFSPSMSWGEIT